MLEEYQGQYLNDQKHGLGTLTNVDGVYEGDFVNDKREGNVWHTRLTIDKFAPKCLSFPSSSGHDEICRRQYLRRAMEEGHARRHRHVHYQDRVNMLSSPDHSTVRIDEFRRTCRYLIKYEGEWKNDRRHGKGKAVYSDNSVYEGLFRKDLVRDPIIGLLVDQAYTAQ